MEVVIDTVVEISGSGSSSFFVEIGEKLFT